MMRLAPRANLSVYLSIAGLAILLAAPEVQALRYQYKVQCVRNDTPYSIKVSNQWGSEGWKHRTLAPGKSHTFWYKNRNSPAVPTLTISFDKDPGPGQISRNFTLWTFYSNSTTCHKGPTATLVVKSSGRIGLDDLRNKY